MGSYKSKERAERIVNEVRMGIMAPFMIEEIVKMDTSVPEFAREEVIRLANEMLVK